jgi:nucleotide-binding universal stress UspA family protein
MKNLLVAVDDSEASLKGARAALTLADALGAKVSLLYVVPPMLMPGDAPWAPIEEIHEAELRRAQGALAAIASGLGRTDLELLVKIGPPAETISEVAELTGTDLVVVGSTGKGMVKRLLVGSCADRLVHICTRPVLVVR